MSLFTPPNVRPTDEDNVVLAGAKWRFCLAGTTTPASIYTTSALNVAHTNPVEAVGTHFPPIYLDPTVSYRATLQTSAGATVTGYDFDPIEQMSSNSLVYTPAGTGAVATTVQTKLRRVQVDIEDFGGGTGVSDNTAACKAALAAIGAAGGGVLQLGAGTYQFASATLGSGGMETVPNLVVRGRGKGVTTILVTGSSPCYIFFNEGNHSNQLYCDFTARGNSVATNNTNGCFYYCSVLSGTATASVINCQTRNVRWENFGSDNWMRFYCSHATYTISNCGIDWGCEAHSETGNARGPTNIGIVSYIVEFRGEGGQVNDCFVNGLSGDLDYVKGAITCFGNVNRMKIRSPDLRNGFQGYSNSDKGGYTITLYGLNPSDNPGDALIENPVIINPYSCGIYVADGFGVQITNPIIRGQEDTGDATLPKGAIAINGANNVRITNPDLSGNAINIAINCATTTTFAADMDLQVIGGSGRGATDVGVKIKASIAYALAGGIHFIGYRDTGGANGALQMFPAAGAGYSDVTFEGFDFGSAKTAINLNVNAAASHSSTGIVFRNGRVSSAGASYFSFAATGANAGRLVLDNIAFDSAPLFHVVMDASTKVEIMRNRFNGTPGTANMELAGTQGIMRDNVAANGLDLVSTTGTALGESAPTWAAGPGSFVQNRAAGLTGTTPTAYRMLGWEWVSGTTWTEVRTGLV